MDFAEHDEKIFAGSGRRIGRRLPRLSSPRALQGEDVGGGDKKGIEDVGSRKEKQGVEKLKPLEDRPRPEEDQFEKEVLVGKGIAEIEHHPGRRGEHACEEGSHLKDLPNHDDRKSTRLNSSHGYISYAVFCLKKKKIIKTIKSRMSVLCTNGIRAVL